MSYSFGLERKFLVSDVAAHEVISSLGENSVGALVRQGYVAIDLGAKSETRVQEYKPDGDTSAYSLRIRSGTSSTFNFGTIDIDRDTFQYYWEMANGRTLQKRRHVVPHVGHTMLLDMYQGLHEGKVLASVNFADELSAREFEAPDWCSTEVTWVDKYSGRSMATESALLRTGGRSVQGIPVDPDKMATLTEL